MIYFSPSPYFTQGAVGDWWLVVTIPFTDSAVTTGNNQGQSK